MITRPSACMLFPYTTLFRSLDRRIRFQPDAFPHAGLLRLRRQVQALARDVVFPSVIGTARGPAFGAGGVRRDRKSTRLNSSHITSSYTVCELQKKIPIT